MISDEDKVAIYENLLIRLHTARWTGNHIKLADLLDRIGKFSYARTNNVEGQTQEEQDQLWDETIENLKY